jgi:hypothetical protein
MIRLKQWCEDINKAQDDARFDFIFVDEEGFKKYRPRTFAALADGFNEYKGKLLGDYGVFPPIRPTMAPKPICAMVRQLLMAYLDASVFQF